MCSTYSAPCFFKSSAPGFIKSSAPGFTSSAPCFSSAPRLIMSAQNTLSDLVHVTKIENDVYTNVSEHDLPLQ